MIPALRKDGQMAETNEEKASMLLKTFFPVPPDPEGEDLPVSVRRRQEPLVGMPDRVSAEEVSEAILSSYPRKAPGRDRLPFLVWQKIMMRA